MARVGIALAAAMILPLPMTNSDLGDYTWGGSVTGSGFEFNGSATQAGSALTGQNGATTGRHSSGTARGRGASHGVGGAAGDAPPSVQFDGENELIYFDQNGRRIMTFGVPGQAQPAASAPAPAASAPQAPDPATLITQRDVAQLAAQRGTISISPARTEVLINKPVYYSTDATAHNAELTVLGVPVTVHLTPVIYTWSPGDGSASFTSTSPGGAWPNGTISHTYAHPTTGVSVGLTVTWSASFTAMGTTYQVPGTVAVSSQSAPFSVVEAETRLK